jgi:hypothetical protein
LAFKEIIQYRPTPTHRRRPNSTQPLGIFDALLDPSDSRHRLNTQNVGFEDQTLGSQARVACYHNMITVVFSKRIQSRAANHCYRTDIDFYCMRTYIVQLLAFLEECLPIVDRKDENTFMMNRGTQHQPHHLRLSSKTSIAWLAFSPLASYA